MIRVEAISGKKDVKGTYKLEGVLAAIRSAVLSVVHTTTRAIPMQLVFGGSALLNISFEANWQYIKERKQRRIVQNNRKENSKLIPHEYKPGDEVMICLNPSSKHGKAQFESPNTVACVNDNDTVQLSVRPPLTVELSTEHGTSTTWTHAWTDHSCQKIPWCSPSLLSKPLE
jgi:hypothetical protein